MNKKFAYVSILMVPMTLLSSLSFAAKMKGDDISNIIIKGDNRLTAHSEIPSQDWSPDIYKEVPTHLRNNSLLGELKPPALKEPPLTLADKSMTKKTASPWLLEIYSPPVVTLSVQPQKEEKKVNWIFRVKDSEGKAFYEMKKRGVIPREIPWNGFGGNKRPLQVGYDYTYHLFIIDEAGNPQRHAGHPFNIDSFRYNKGNGTITSFYPESIFTDVSTLKISDSGSRYLNEMKDYLRNRYRNKVEIVAYDKDLKFALARARVIRQFVVESLDFPEDKITAQGLTPKEGQGYRHVDIITK